MYNTNCERGGIVKLKSVMLLSLFLLTGCDEVEKQKFLGTYKTHYVGLEEGIIQEVVYKYDEKLIEEIRVSCDYYVELNDGKELKFSVSRLSSETVCRYEKGDNVKVEVLEDTVGDTHYSLVGIN